MTVLDLIGAGVLRAVALSALRAGVSGRSWCRPVPLESGFLAGVIFAAGMYFSPGLYLDVS